MTTGYRWGQLPSTHQLLCRQVHASSTNSHLWDTSKIVCRIRVRGVHDWLQHKRHALRIYHTEKNSINQSTKWEVIVTWSDVITAISLKEQCNSLNSTHKQIVLSKWIILSIKTSKNDSNKLKIRHIVKRSNCQTMTKWRKRKYYRRIYLLVSSPIIVRHF